MDEYVEVSVIMSTFNEEIMFIKESINSILAQTYDKFEFIIVLDNPKNIKLNNYIKQLSDNRIKIIENDINIGLTNSLNKAIDISRGTFIARMDADDISAIDRIEKQLNYMKVNKEVAILGSNVNFIDEEGNSIKQLNTNDIPTNYYEIKERMKISNVMFHPTLMMRRDIITHKSINKYRNIFAAEDYDLICRVILSGYKVENLKYKLLDYRVRDCGISKSNEFMQLKVANLIAKYYSEKNLKNIECDQINSIKNDTKGLKNYIIANKIKKFYKGDNKLINIFFKMLGNILSQYHFKRALYVFAWKLKRKGGRIC